MTGAVAPRCRPVAPALHPRGANLESVAAVLHLGGFPPLGGTPPATCNARLPCMAGKTTAATGKHEDENSETLRFVARLRSTQRGGA
jgi:hypothetical protein